MKIPTSFGFPLWTGRLKKKVAKRNINSGNKKIYRRFIEFADYKVGDLILDCTNFNVRITELHPQYKQIRGGCILLDVDIISARNSASFYSCGIEHPKSYEELVLQKELETKHWEGEGDPYGFADRWKKAVLNEDGTISEPDPS